MTEQYTTPEMLISFLEESDVLTASGEVYEDESGYKDYEAGDAGEWDDFDFGF